MMENGKEKTKTDEKRLFFSRTLPFARGVSVSVGAVVAGPASCTHRWGLAGGCWARSRAHPPKGLPEAVQRRCMHRPQPAAVSSAPVALIRWHMPCFNVLRIMLPGSIGGRDPSMPMHSICKRCSLPSMFGAPPLSIAFIGLPFSKTPWFACGVAARLARASILTRRAPAASDHCPL